ncbi:MAG TPA: hypothetical protein PK640_18910 [Verrucomicrobiota bacterium]|nr:hypothetical protein [Verrucomicrobiota bacterium]
MPCDTLHIQAALESGILSCAVRVVALAVALIVGVAVAVVLRKGGG